MAGQNLARTRAIPGHHESSASLVTRSVLRTHKCLRSCTAWAHQAVVQAQSGNWPMTLPLRPAGRLRQGKDQRQLDLPSATGGGNYVRFHALGTRHLAGCAAPCILTARCSSGYRHQHWHGRRMLWSLGPYQSRRKQRGSHPAPAVPSCSFSCNSHDTNFRAESRYSALTTVESPRGTEPLFGAAQTKFSTLTQP